MRSSNDEAIGPITVTDSHAFSSSTLPYVGLSPYKPQYAEGIRMLPPPSAPIETENHRNGLIILGQSPNATAHADPDELPPE